MYHVPLLPPGGYVYVSVTAEGNKWLTAALTTVDKI